MPGVVWVLLVLFFFFQAEDGIRDLTVTGVQTCALPITLLAWMERHAAATYGAVLAADRAGVAVHAGHGNAIAMPYHHTILPLSSRRDKEAGGPRGVGGLRRRLGREPEGVGVAQASAGG